jgi:hypothetical protein
LGISPNQHPEFYAKDFTEDVEILLSFYEGRSPSAIPPVTGEDMITNWKNYGGYYDRVKAIVGLAHAMLDANRLFPSGYAIKALVSAGVENRYQRKLIFSSLSPIFSTALTRRFARMMR